MGGIGNAKEANWQGDGDGGEMTRHQEAGWSFSEISKAE
jgi:hypothetical protein